MFQFPTFASPKGYPEYFRMGCPIRTSPDRRLFAPPRSFSQLVTSFFASESLGIPRTLLIYFLIIFFLEYFTLLYLSSMSKIVS
jgi:hypothetical protein